MTHKNVEDQKATTYYAPHREKILAVQAVYRKTHAKERSALNAAYRAIYRADLRVAATAYRRAYPEIEQAAKTRRRARKLNAPINDFTARQWRMMQEVYDHRCVYCKKRFKGKLTQDHIQPLSKGGSHTLANIVPACQSCNSKKNAGPVLVPVQPLLLIDNIISS